MNRPDLMQTLYLPAPSSSFPDIHGEGVYKPAPGIGSPALVWHLGIQRDSTPYPASGDFSQFETLDFLKRYRDETDEFYLQISHLLEGIQARGIIPGVDVQRLSLSEIPLGDGIVVAGATDRISSRTRTPFPFKTYRKQSLGFEAWWRDGVGGSGPQSPWTDQPPTSAIRIFVQLQSFQDHVTLSFYMDVAKPFGMAQINTSNEVEAKFGDTRRNEILKRADIVRKSSLEQIRTGSVDTPSAEQPEGITVSREQLAEASHYLYERVWNDFARSFGLAERQWSNDLTPDRTRANKCATFTSQRGVMMSIKGLEKIEVASGDTREDIRAKLIAANLYDTPNPRPLSKQDWEPDYTGATTTLGPVDVFNEKIGEPETILKSVWPFLQVAFPEAVARNWVGCGILDWRALLVLDINSNASEAQFAENDARLIHQRFLILSKGEPHREQIGRFVERFVALETMRLYALRYKEIIRNAYITLANVNRKLDGVWEEWTAQRDLIEAQYEDVKSAWKRHDKNKKSVHSILSKHELARERDYFHELRVLSSTIERQLIRIAAQLDCMGPSGAGQLGYKINHAEHYINEYRRMTPTLEIGNIHGWMNYQQFSDRNMQPSFEMIRRTGQRLSDTQDHLRSLTEVVQTGVEIVHSHATQRNTDQLSKIATHFFVIKYSILGLLGAWLLDLVQKSGIPWDTLWDWIRWWF